MDYVLVTYLVSENSALSYAVGEWARVWTLQSLIRAMGGYFVRRDSSNPLYRKVLARYVHMATASGVAQAVFPEGGLTRDGKLRPPKLGMLSYIVSLRPAGPRDIVFVPVGLNYDRVLEDRIQIAAAATPQGRAPALRLQPRRPRRLPVRSLWLRVQRPLAPLRLRLRQLRPAAVAAQLSRRARRRPALAAEQQRFAEIQALGPRLMREVGRVVPGLPVSLVASAILSGGERGLSGLELKGSVFELMRRLKAMGAHVHIPRQDEEYAVDVGLRMLMLRHLVNSRERRLSAKPQRDGAARLLRQRHRSSADGRMRPTGWLPSRHWRRLHRPGLRPVQPDRCRRGRRSGGRRYRWSRPRACRLWRAR